MAGHDTDLMTALDLLDFLNDDSIPDEALVFARTGNVTVLLNTAVLKDGKVWLSCESKIGG